METFFLVCAAVGGTLLLCQFVLGFMGLGHHDIDHDSSFDHGHDVDHDHESWFVGVLTFRTVVAALTFFGLGGLIAVYETQDPIMPLGVAVVCGAAALFGVAWMMKLLQRLKADGTTRIDRAVGNIGTVYLSIPANNAGAGKVTVKLQNRTVEYQAISRNEALATGTPIQVVAVVGPDIVEVIPVPQAERISHV
ncbi:MAG TPA: NfeD family protein [Gemmataceae bacterium]|nr:NfeD family protein [Gemmataceae bacterium]